MMNILHPQKFASFNELNLMKKSKTESILLCGSINPYNGNTHQNQIKTTDSNKTINNIKNDNIKNIIINEKRNVADLKYTSCCYNTSAMQVSVSKERRKPAVLVKKKLKKIVRFADMPDLIMSVITIQYLLDDIEKSWYSMRDYESFKDDIKFTIAMFKSLSRKQPMCKKISNIRISKEFCLRGIERIIWRNRAKKLVVKSVLQQQTKIDRNNNNSAKPSPKFPIADETIRISSLIISQHCCETAIHLATRDAKVTER